MGTLQLIEVTPQQLQEEILKGIKAQLKEFASLFKTPQEEYLTREETAKLLKVDLSTLWHWKNKGILVPYGLSNRVYYMRSDVDKAMVKLN
ncbi:MAG: helix-turn-helix domain-containing protein [Flavobacterium sp.]|uniref:helix-turn-helix domain-containing protein n=1 Tax=Flavobacterium sp. TaxID=239 RepID=UPI0026101EEB|nr:helix-turn-helix domain-containing protein [Flavobacterium sp.]MDD5151102.1 helix-turn-helix domain-containing protein [Flavobacterium sp.]